MSMILLMISVIFLLWLASKRARGKPLSSLDKVAAVVAIISGMAGLIFSALPDMPSQGRVVVVTIAMVIFVLSVVWWGWIGRRKSAHDLCRHLTVHYSQKRADGEKLTIDNARHPYWLVNIRNRRGFAVPLRVKPLVRYNIIEGMTHDGQPALKEWLERNKISIDEYYPATDDDLEINVDKILHMCKLET